jgi:hypothetical protein
VTALRWDETWHRLIEWTNEKGSTVQPIAAGLAAGEGPDELYFSHQACHLEVIPMTAEARGLDTAPSIRRRRSDFLATSSTR